MMDIAKLQTMVQASERIVFFGGAGTSTESGIPDFRSADGLYHTSSGMKYPPEVILSRDFFYMHTEDFYAYYKEHLIHTEAKPNPAHHALVKLEEQGKLSAIVTQNIDSLHQLAGSSNVLELHGSVHRNYCLNCDRFHSLEEVLSLPGTVPRCVDCGGLVKPDVVLYQEGLDMDVLESAIHHIQRADMLIVAGTSLTVHPAAGLVRYYRGDRFVLINKSSTPYDNKADVVIRDSIGKVLAQIVD
jgi:NAD-dependent deacetylase